jgi:predicted ATP-dependent Lon-type protease
VKLGDVDHKASWDCKKINGYHSIHFVPSISHRDYTLLNVKELACFYPKCIDDNSKFCHIQTHVKPWRLLKLDLSMFHKYLVS